MEAIPVRAHFDNQYIENWSWWNDIAIMLRTFRLVVTGDEPASADALDRSLLHGSTRP